MVSNLNPRSVQGVGGETSFIESHLLDSAGRVRDLDEVARKIGDQSMQFAYLDYELREHLRRPMARGYPPRIFLSYRRETPEHVRWCVDLAHELETAGYEVMLDALAISEDNPPPEVIARFVGQLATADVAMTILTPSYVGNRQEMRRWIFEEWLRIEALRTWGLLEMPAKDTIRQPPARKRRPSRHQGVWGRRVRFSEVAGRVVLVWCWGVG